MVDIFLNISDYLFSFFCHQQTDLLIHINGEILPMCYRCGGIYTGIALSLPFLPLVGKLPNRWYLGLALILTLLVEWTLANIGITNSSQLSRSITGFTGGLGLCFMLSHYFHTFNYPYYTTILITIIVLPALSLATTIELTITLTFLHFWSRTLQRIIYGFLSKYQKGEHYGKLSKYA